MVALGIRFCCYIRSAAVQESQLSAQLLGLYFVGILYQDFGTLHQDLSKKGDFKTNIRILISQYFTKCQYFHVQIFECV